MTSNDDFSAELCVPTASPSNPTTTAPASPAGQSVRDRISPDTDAPHIRLRDPEDIIGIVPYLLGFHPRESVVAVFLDGSRIALTGRLDLPSLPDLPGLADHLVALGTRHNAPDLIVVVYSRRARGGRVGEALAAALQPLVREVLLVGDRRWWSLTCVQGCCPEQGTSFDPSSLRVSAEAVLAGLTTLGDRRLVVDQVRGPDAGDVPALQAGLHQQRAALTKLSRARRKELVHELVLRALAEPAEGSDETCLRLAALVGDIDVRDVAWLLMTRERAEEHVDLWRRVVSRTPPAAAAGPVCLLGVAGWIAGQGALLNCCIDRAAALDPTYTMVDLLSDISAAAVPPTYWDAWSESMREHPRLQTGLRPGRRRR